MNFGSVNQKKESVAEKARRERQEREAKRKADAEVSQRSQSATKIQIWFRKQQQFKGRITTLISQWDSWTGFSPSHQPPSSAVSSPARGQTESSSASPLLTSLDLLKLAPLQAWELLRIMGVFLSFYDERDLSHSQRLAFLCRLLLDFNRSKDTLGFAAALSDPARRSAAVPVLTKFMTACLRRVCQSDIGTLDHSSHGTNPYLSGTELRLCVIFWDLKRWGSDLAALTAVMAVRQAIMEDRGGFQLLKDASLHRVKMLYAIQHRKLKDRDDEKKANSILLWLFATIHIGLLCCTEKLPLPMVAKDEHSRVVERNVIFFLTHVFSAPLLVKVLDSRCMELLKSSNILTRTLASINLEENIKMILKYAEGEVSLFLLGNVVELYRQTLWAAKQNHGDAPTSAADSTLQQLVSFSTLLLNDCRRYVSAKASNKARFHPVFQWYTINSCLWFQNNCSLLSTGTVVHH
jgi:hypothetical protein